jgi:drug/metabolite transporter (DMT)-like permease
MPLNAWWPLPAKAGTVGLLMLGVMAVAAADICLKHASLPGSLAQALRSPWTWVAAGLYLVQVALFAVVFANGWKLSVVGLLQTALYAVVTLSAGVLLFGEVLTVRQLVGIALALAGVALLSA